ncbi:MAG: hypothetical protein IJE43_01610 [Alphaproteobacteria bacterium]|nr:hypothetical protein [Alphaproteobacteria bacterium]
MGKISSDFERFLYANYPDDYMRATAEDVPDDVITAILSRHSFHYEVWKDIPEWIRAEYRDDIPVEVLNGNTRVEDFIYDEYEKLTPEGQEKAKEEQEKEEREAMFVANLTVAFLAAGYTAEAVSHMAENHRERSSILKQMGIYGRTPELVAAYRATRESDKKIIEDEYDGNEKLVHKKVLRLVKQLNRMKRSKDGYDEEKYKETEAKLKEVMAFVASNPEARKKIEEHLKDPVAKSALRHLVPEVSAMFGSLMGEADLLPALQEAMAKSDKTKGAGVITTALASSKAQDVEVMAKSFEQTSEKSVLRFAKALSRMQKSQNGYDEKEYAILEEKLQNAVALLSGNDELKKGIVDYLKQPSSQGAIRNLTDDIRNKFVLSLKDVGILVNPNEGGQKNYEISRDTLVEGLKKDFAECEKMEKILANKLGHKNVEFMKARVQDVVSTIPNDKIDKLVMMSRGENVSIT